MITFLLAEKEKKLQEIIVSALAVIGDKIVCIKKTEEVIQIFEDSEIHSLVSFEEKFLEMLKSLYYEKKGMLYQAMLERTEKQLFDWVLQQTDGNQLKAAKLLGVNRNTLRSKLRKYSINTAQWKI